jgi:sugar-specific transcriptional regulator TrmB
METTANQVQADINAAAERSRLELIQENDRLIKDIEELKQLASRYQHKSDELVRELSGVRDTVQEWLLEQLDSGEWSDEQPLQDLAQGVGVELAREYQVTVLVEYHQTILARSQDAAQELVDELDIPRMEIGDEYTYGEIIESTVEQA